MNFKKRLKERDREGDGGGGGEGSEGSGKEERLGFTSMQIAVLRVTAGNV